MRKGYKVEYFLPQFIVGKASLKSVSRFLMNMFGKKNMTLLMLQKKEEEKKNYRKRGRAFPQPDLMKPINNWTLWEKGLAGGSQGPCVVSYQCAIKALKIINK